METARVAMVVLIIGKKLQELEYTESFDMGNFNILQTCQVLTNVREQCLASGKSISTVYRK